MSFEHDDSDYWTNTAGASGASCGAAPMSAPLLDIEHTPNVAPLDRQMGVMPPLTVPAELHDSLFGEGARGAQIYAILDGAKLEGLRELLEASKLDYACLFQGDAAIELGDVAPYIVRLEDGNRFTRRLFTTGTAPWQVWAKVLPALLRAAAGP